MQKKLTTHLHFTPIRHLSHNRCRLSHTSHDYCISADIPEYVYCMPEYVYCISDYVYCISEYVYCISDYVYCISEYVYCITECFYCVSANAIYIFIYFNFLSYYLNVLFLGKQIIMPYRYHKAKSPFFPKKKPHTL